MSAKELKAIADVGITLGYSGDELKQFVNDERMWMDKEKELERQRKEKEAEIQRQEKAAEKQREIEESERRRKFELEKLKVE